MMKGKCVGSGSKWKCIQVDSYTLFYWFGIICIILMGVIGFYAGRKSVTDAHEGIDWNNLEPLSTFKLDGKEQISISPTEFAAVLPHRERGRFVHWYKSKKAP